MSCRVGDLSLSISWFVCEFFSVGEFLSPSCYSVSCLSVSCRVTGHQAYQVGLTGMALKKTKHGF